MNLNALIFSEVNVYVRPENYEKAKKFYEEVLCLKKSREGLINVGTPDEAKMASYLVGPVSMNVSTSTGPQSVVFNKAMEHYGEGVNHICFYVDPDDRAELEENLKPWGRGPLRMVSTRGDRGAIFSDRRATFGVLYEFMNNTFIKTEPTKPGQW